MAQDGEGGPIYAFVCCSLIGVGLLIGGAVWMDSLPKDACPCNSVQCCSMDESCPLDTPCLCLSVQIESANSSCSPYKKRSRSKVTSAESIILVGVFITSIPAFIVIVLSLHLVFGLCTRLVLTLSSIFHVFYGTIRELGSVSKTMISKLSRLWVLKRVNPVGATGASSIRFSEDEIEPQ